MLKKLISSLTLRKLSLVCLSIGLVATSFLAVSAATDQDKMRGCILGAAMGDALGAPVEFLRSMHEIRKQYPPLGIQGIHSLKSKDFAFDECDNQVIPYTDDTGMSLLVLETLNENKRKSMDATLGTLAKKFADDMDQPFGWARPSRAPGNACLKNIKIIKERIKQKANIKDPRNWWKAGGAKDGGCGSVMHAHPFGLIFSNDPAKAELWAVEHSKITHGAPIALAACAAMAVGVAHAFNDVEPKQVAQAMMDAASKYDQNTATKISKAIAYAHNTSVSSEKVFQEFLGWAADDAIAATIYSFLCYPDDLQKAIIFGVNTPGDSDSIASMAGALVGARVGMHQLPDEWLELLEGKEKLLLLADTIFRNNK